MIIRGVNHAHLVLASLVGKTGEGEGGAREVVNPVPVHCLRSSIVFLLF